MHRASRRELHGIVDEIGEHLAKPDRVALDEAWAAHAHIDGAQQPLVARPRLQLAADAFHQLMQIEHRAVQLEAPCLELGIVEDVVQHGQQTARRLLQGLGIASLVALERAVEQKLRH